MLSPDSNATSLPYSDVRKGVEVTITMNESQWLAVSHYAEQFATLGVEHELIGEADPDAVAGYKLIDEAMKRFYANDGPLHNAETYLRNLLAIIHRDGGHYAQDNGLEKATEDAIKIVCDLRTEQSEDAPEACRRHTKEPCCDFVPRCRCVCHRHNFNSLEKPCGNKCGAVYDGTNVYEVCPATEPTVQAQPQDEPSLERLAQALFESQLSRSSYSWEQLGEPPFSQSYWLDWARRLKKTLGETTSQAKDDPVAACPSVNCSFVYHFDVGRMFCCNHNKLFVDPEADRE